MEKEPSRALKIFDFFINLFIFALQAFFGFTMIALIMMID